LALYSCTSTCDAKVSIGLVKFASLSVTLAAGIGMQRFAPASPIAVGSDPQCVDQL